MGTRLRQLQTYSRQMKTINIKTIRIDGGTQSRVEINNEIVTEYAEAIKAGAEFPAVVVFNDGVDNWLADGFHRFHAHNQAGKTSIAADVRPGTVRDAKLFSFGANGRHGQRPTNADKRKSVSEMLADSEWAAWSQVKIADTCGVSIGFVSKMVHEAASFHGEMIKPATRTVERNGKTYEQDTSSIGKSKPTPEIASVVPVILAIDDEGAPDDAEMESVRIQEESAAKTMQFMLASDEPLADLAAKNTELEAQIKQLNLRIAGLQNSNNEYIKTIKRLQAQLKKVQA